MRKKRNWSRSSPGCGQSSEITDEKGNVVDVVE
jgi:hypothetical protein